MSNTPQTSAHLEELETWQNNTHARHELKKFSSKGDVMGELIGSDKTFHVTVRERHLNQELAADDDLDPFKNGMFSPVRLVEATDDADEIAANPNLMTETEMLTLAKANVKTLEKRLNEVRNPVVVERLLQVANDSDATVGRVQVIKARLAELSPSLYTEVVSTQSPGER